MDSTESFTDRVGAAALTTIPSLATLAVLARIAPPTPSQRAAADPIIVLLGDHALAITVAIGALVIAVWSFASRPHRRVVRRAIVLASAGAAAAIAVCVLVRISVGPDLPTFIPSEESQRPGLSQGLAAGVLEEAVFRLAILPLTFLLASRYAHSRIAAVTAIAVTALSFATLHEVGQGADSFRLDHFVTRALIPGAGMSVIVFAVDPAFIVAAHCTAHLIIPFLFR